MKPLLGAPLLALSVLVVVMGVGVLLRWRVRAWLRIAASLLLVLPGLAGGTVGGYWFWFTHRSQPEPVREQWFAGVRYERLVLQQPRPVVAHLVRVDLQEPGIGFVVTAPQPSASGDVFADKTSGFAARQGVQLAVNANFYYGKQPAYSEGLTLAEAADLLLKHGGHTGIQLDGGGSATLVRQDAQGRIQLVNTPTNFRIAGWERVVATHLGISARPIERP